MAGTANPSSAQSTHGRSAGGAVEHRISTLDCGLRVASERVPAVRSVAVGFVIGTGSANEQGHEAGISHLLEHMLFRGTPHFSSSQIDQIFDEMGSGANAETDKEATSVTARVLDSHLPLAFRVIGEMVFQPTLQDLAAERDVVLQEIAAYEDDPQELVFDRLGEAVFGERPLGRAVIGSADAVAAIDSAHLGAYHRDHYLPGEIVIAAAGSIDHDELVAMAQESVAGAPAFAQAPVSEARETPGGEAQVGAGRSGGSQDRGAPGGSLGRVRFQSKETEQYHVCLGAPGIARSDERRFALRVLEGALGATPSSRLFQEVREKRGLAYSVFSFSALYGRTGEVGIYLGTRPENLAEALDVIAAELARICEEPIAEEELVRSRECAKSSVILALESSSARMARLGASVLWDLPILSPEEIIERIDAVSAEQCADLARLLFAAQPVCAAGIG
ncbi:MAG: insulinase family protein, partial [Acidobacteriota bacterium]|nr:insulinase family protein [Acidobacteriota bacterium]